MTNVSRGENANVRIVLRNVIVKIITFHCIQYMLYIAVPPGIQLVLWRFFSLLYCDLLCVWRRFTPAFQSVISVKKLGVVNRNIWANFLKLGMNICFWRLRNINPIKTKLRLLYLKTQVVPRCKHFSSGL